MAIEFEKGVSTRLDKLMHEELTSLAKEEQRPLSNMVRVLLIEAMHYRKLGVNDKELVEYLEAKKQGGIATPSPQYPPPVPK